MRHVNARFAYRLEASRISRLPANWGSARGESKIKPIAYNVITTAHCLAVKHHVYLAGDELYQATR